MKVLLVCALGASTGVIVNKMKRAAQSDADIDNSNLYIEAVAAENFKERFQEFDVVLMGPQIRFKEKEFRSLCEPEGVALSIIPASDYGMMRGDNILKLAAKLYKENHK